MSLTLLFKFRPQRHIELLKDIRIVYLFQVNHGSEAEKVGLREGDIISAMNELDGGKLTKAEAQMVQNEPNPILHLKLNQ